MAIIKCKMCGGDLNLIEGASTAECEYCGSVQTVPKVDDDKKLTLFARANRLRAACEFDKAAGIYESIVADFSEEAEAYWGLVLCKYGIEYVDDPATGKKIPTCHRSGFDSVLEDQDFEQAFENADSAARKVYREEAKQIEELRRGIIAVSANEEPYDIFICYKETGENGERTLDSVLAQDVYDTLTTKGYRVFFSRVTLEDKLGVEYEPYIFAALNSAKIMLAFGTDFDYYNAVWVKNEWSRYLKLMAKDKDKHLIPCYKGIDAYDMPKEFAKLQAQDLGKVGAMQDLMRGIEKILPRQNTAAAPVAPAGNRSNAMLTRGHFALEDAAWDRAVEFFEDVLNQDAQCGEAYFGLFLAEQQCKDLQAVVQKRVHLIRDAIVPEAKTSEQQDAYFETRKQQLLTKYTARGLLSPQEVLLELPEKMTFDSTAAAWDNKEQELKIFVETTKSLQRALQFANPELKQQLAGILSDWNNIIRANQEQAKQQDAQAEADIMEVLEQQFAQTDESLHLKEQKNERIFEAKYQQLCQQQETTTDIWQLDSISRAFLTMKNYKDCLQRSNWCKEQVANSKKASANKQQQLAMWVAAGRCSHCGGELKGMFTKKCVSCGKPKNY